MTVFSRPVEITDDADKTAVVFFIRKLRKLIRILSTGVRKVKETLDKLIDLFIDFLLYLGVPIYSMLSELELFRVFAERPLTSTLPLLFVINILSLIYVAVAHCALPAAGLSLLSRESLAFHLVTVLALLCYYRAVVTDPGRIPDTADWREGGAAAAILERKRSSGLLRFCNKEKKYKPDRAHFCSPMERNVLKMDHYCPWLANCVGFGNHKYFFLFLLYATIATDAACYGLGQVLWQGRDILQPAHVFFLSQGLCLTSILGAVLTPFTAFHVWLISNNRTTIEFCEKRRGGTTNDYDLGFFKNWAAVLGSNPVYCLLPINTLEGTGLQFPRKSQMPEVAEAAEAQEELIAALQRRARASKCVPVVAPADACMHWWGAVLDGCNGISDFTLGAVRGLKNILSL